MRFEIKIMIEKYLKEKKKLGDYMRKEIEEIGIDEKIVKNDEEENKKEVYKDKDLDIEIEKKVYRGDKEI